MTDKYIIFFINIVKNSKIPSVLREKLNIIDMVIGIIIQTYNIFI